jgi:DNA-binding FrmR family transcriptional regulator
MSVHLTHPDIIKRLRRAEGHLRSIVTMLEEERPCVEIAQQLHAVEAAVSSAKRALVHDHIDHCLDHTGSNNASGTEAAIRELKAITRYL